LSDSARFYIGSPKEEWYDDGPRRRAVKRPQPRVPAARAVTSVEDDISIEVLLAVRPR